MKRFWVWLPIFLLILISCGPKDNLEKEATAIINSNCKKCHSLKRVYNNKGRDANWWAETVSRMQNYGANLSEEEKDLIIKYLSRR